MLPGFTDLVTDSDHFFDSRPFPIPAVNIPLYDEMFQLVFKNSHHIVIIFSVWGTIKSRTFPDQFFDFIVTGQGVFF